MENDYQNYIDLVELREHVAKFVGRMNEKYKIDRISNEYKNVTMYFSSENSRDDIAKYIYDILGGYLNGRLMKFDIKKDEMNVFVSIELY